MLPSTVLPMRDDAADDRRSTFVVRDTVRPVALAARLDAWHAPRKRDGRGDFGADHVAVREQAVAIRGRQVRDEHEVVAVASMAISLPTIGVSC
jgi:hypothetical protein